MTEPITIGIGANKWIKDSDTKIITLANNGSMPNGYASLVIAGSGPGGSMTKYQVPVGKKFIILSWQSYVAHSSVFSYTIPDINAGNRLDYILAGYGSQNGGGEQPTYIEIPAGYYITIYEYNQYPTMCIGVECNA